MNVLVTGGAGYIGSHAVRKLLDGGHKVVVLDDLSHGYREAVPPEATFIEGSIADTDLVIRALRDNAIQAVMHFAAFIEVGESVTDPSKYYRNNTSGAVALLDAMRFTGVRYIVFSSTAAVYGNPVSTPIEEEHPLAPINPYGRSKMMTELVFEDYRSAYGIGYTILRYFNVAGAHPSGTIGEAHEPESHLIPRILQSARDPSQVMRIYGTDYPTPDGTCIRDYIHVEDLVEAHVLALEHGMPAHGQVFNLGSEDGFSVREVIEACERVTGRSLRVEEHARRPGDPAVLVASSRRIREMLGWQRKYPDLETMIAHAWNWHSKHPHGYKREPEHLAVTLTGMNAPH